MALNYSPFLYKISILSLSLSLSPFCSFLPFSVFLSLSLFAGPTGPPTNVNAVATNPRMVNVTWEPPVCGDQNGPITSYNVHYTYASQIITPSPISVDGLNTSFELPRSFQRYDIEVAAVNDAGAGVRSNAINIVVIDSKFPR